MRVFVRTEMNIDAYNLPRPSVLARKKLEDEIKALKKSVEMLEKANKYGIEAWRLQHLEDEDSEVSKTISHLKDKENE